VTASSSRTTPLFALLWAAGAAGAALAGALAFGKAVAVPGHPPFQAINAGLLVAGVIASVRASKPGAGLALVSGWTALHLGATLEAGWPAVVASPFACLGMGFAAFLAAAVFDDLARRGYVFGKFLIAGPMLAGFWIALTPSFLLGRDSHERLLAEILRNAFLGLVIGDGAGFGVEAAEWSLARLRRTAGGPAEGGEAR
jgi:hypothetical protein